MLQFIELLEGDTRDLRPGKLWVSKLGWVNRDGFPWIDFLGWEVGREAGLGKLGGKLG